jgi:hypothetical protein
MQMPISSNDFADMQAMLLAAQKRRKRRLILFWLLGTVIVAGLATGIYSYNQAADTVAQNTTNTTVAPITPQDNNTTFEGSMTENNTTTPSTNSPNSATLFNGLTKPETGAANTSTQVTKSTTKPIQKSTKRNTTTTTKNSENESTKKDEQQVILNNPEPDNADNSTDKTVEDNTETKQTQTTVTLPESPGLDNNENANTATQQVAETKDSASDKMNKSTGNSNITEELSPFSISINAGPALNTFGIGNAGTYSQIRNNGDKPGVGFNGAITVNYKLKDFSLSAGLGYNSIAGGGKYNYTHQIHDSFPVYSQPPNAVIIGYVYTNYRDTTHNYALQNRFTYVTLPVAVSYSFPFNKSKTSGISLGLGVQVQRLVGVSGEYINPANLFKFDLNSTDNFIRKWNVNTRLAVGYYHTFGKFFTLDIGINYWQMMGNMLGKNTNVAVRPRSIGFEAGLRYNFKK